MQETVSASWSQQQVYLHCHRLLSKSDTAQCCELHSLYSMHTGECNPVHLLTTLSTCSKVCYMFVATASAQAAAALLLYAGIATSAYDEFCVVQDVSNKSSAHKATSNGAKCKQTEVMDFAEGLNTWSCLVHGLVQLHTSKS